MPTARQCPACGQLIYFKLSAGGKPMPVNVSDDRSHFITCKDAATFRRPREPAPDPQPRLL